MSGEMTITTLRPGRYGVAALIERSGEVLRETSPVSPVSFPACVGNGGADDGGGGMGTPTFAGM